MLSELQTARKVIGIKQSRKAVKSGEAKRVYVALDAEPRVIRPFCELCQQMGVPVQEIQTMAELGNAVSIDVGAAVVALL